MNTPQKTVILADDVYEQLMRRVEAEGKTLDDAANEAVRVGLGEGRWQRLLERGQISGRAVLGDVSDDEGEQKVVDIVHDWRAEQRSGR